MIDNQPRFYANTSAIHEVVSAHTQCEHYFAFDIKAVKSLSSGDVIRSKTNVGNSTLYKLPFVRGGLQQASACGSKKAQHGSVLSRLFLSLFDSARSTCRAGS